MLDIKRPISQAIRKSKISTDLASDFSQFLSKNPDRELHALYLLNDKNQKIEQVIQDLYEIPISQQATWKKQKKITEKDLFKTKLPKEKPLYDKSRNRVLFTDWKREHGFTNINFGLNRIYTFIRFKAFIDKDFQQKISWTLSKGRYGKRGWCLEKVIRNVARYLSNDATSLGWSVKTYLENNLSNENDALTIPNPLILNSEDSHNFLHLLFGYPLLFYNTSPKTLIQNSQTMVLKMNYTSLSGYKVVFCDFYLKNSEITNEINYQQINRKGAIVIGDYHSEAVIIGHNYWKLQPSTLPAVSIRGALEGIIVPESDWNYFESKWQKLHPELKLSEINDANAHIPDFSLQKLQKWDFWLVDEVEPIFVNTQEAPKFYISNRFKRASYSRLSVRVENFHNTDYEISNAKNCPRIIEFLEFAKQILELKKENDNFLLQRVMASKFLQLAKHYPYIYNCNGENMFNNAKKISFAITIQKEPKKNQYLIEGKLYTIGNNGRKTFIPFLKEKNKSATVVGLIPGYIFFKNEFYETTSIINSRIVDDCLNGIVANESEISDFYATVVPYLKARNIQIFDPQGLLQISAIFNYTLQGVMTISEINGILVGRLKMVMKTDVGQFDYPVYDDSNTFQKNFNGNRVSIPKNKEIEEEIFDKIIANGWVEEEEGVYSMSETNSLNFAINILPEQNEKDLVIYYGKENLKRWKVSVTLPQFNTIIKHHIDWFSLNISFDNQDIDISKLMDIWKSGEKCIDLGNKKGLVLINKDWMERYAPILNRLTYDSQTTVKKELLVKKYNFGLLEELTGTANRKSKNWQPLKIVEQKIPDTVKANLRQYQQEGVNWLCFLRKNNFSGILADDMGLGKTLQALAFFEVIRKSKKTTRYHRPHLVVGPTSVVTNWKEEVLKFTPELKYILYHGAKRKKLCKSLKTFDLIITSYALLQKESKFFASIKYDIVLLDEAQNIKNARSKTAQAVCLLNSTQRVSLTGTPIENDISEIWSQFNFLMPGFLGNLKEFNTLYSKSSRTYKKEFDFALLRKQTKPFILRRLKKNVAKSLPEKTEQILYCEMNVEQKNLYDSVLQAEKKALMEKISNNQKPNHIKMSFFNALLKLRQICCDPRLCRSATDNPPPSAKLELCIDHIAEIVSEGNRVLVFSQFVKMLNLMHKILDDKNIPFLQLDGSTSQRQVVVDKFQKDSHYPVFLISLKAGGTGINLTAADYVIHYDPWWNPAVESQASDRVYRIGQNKHVFIYKLITKNSIEEKILELQNKKQLLTNNVIGSFKNFDEMLEFKSIQDILS